MANRLLTQPLQNIDVIRNNAEAVQKQGSSRGQQNMNESSFK